MKLKNVIGIFGIAILLFSCKTKQLVKVEKEYTKNYEFPETKYLTEKKNVGVAFSGGGSRSAALTTGQLRALKELNLLKDIKYISAVSGGGWASVCYTYLPENISDATFLGKYIPPEKLVWKDLKTHEKKSMIGCLTRAKIFWRIMGSWFSFKRDESFASILNLVTLKRLGLGNRYKYFAYNSQQLKEINTIDPTIDTSLFYTITKADRPYLIINGTFIGGSRNARGLQSMHLEMTPLYSGITCFDKEMKHPVGGGYFASYGMDMTLVPENTNRDYAKVSYGANRRRFSLSDMMAITGAAPGTLFYRSTLRNIGLPEINLWSPLQYRRGTYPRKQTTKEFAIGDGGNSENLGIIPLLKRKVKTIIVFVNCLTAITQVGETIFVDEAIDRVFGGFQDNEKIEPNKLATGVLKNDNHQLDSLKHRLLRLKNSGQSIIDSCTYKINLSEKYGIFPDSSYNSVKIIWVYNDGPYKFFDSIADHKIRSKIHKGKFNQKTFFATGKFPHYATFGTNYMIKGIDYMKRHAHMLAAFSSWTIMSNGDYFKSVVTGKK